MKREDVYIEQLKALGVWQEAFRPMVNDLAKAERRRTRAEKEWSATVPRGGKPSFTHPLYQTIVQLDRTVMDYREALGLTPKALRRVRGMSAADGAPAGDSPTGDSPTGIAARLDNLLARSAADAWDGGKVAEWSTVDHGGPSQSPPQAAATAPPEGGAKGGEAADDG